MSVGAKSSDSYDDLTSYKIIHYSLLTLIPKDAFY